MIAILLSFVQAKAQTVIASVVAENDVHFANRNFEVGKLTVSLALPTGTTGTVEVTLGNGIEYIANSLVKESGTLNIVHTTSSPANKPVFTLTGSGNIIFSIKRKITKDASSTLFSDQNTFKDIVKVTLSSGTFELKEATYTPVIPVIVVTPSELAHNNASGTSVKTFTLENTGDGATRDIYFSVKYPSGVTLLEIKDPDGNILSPVGTVPVGIGNNTGESLYKLTSSSSAGFKKADKVTITEKYTVTGCQSNREIKYEAYWGESKDILYQMRDKAKAINVETGTPNIVLDIDYNNSNFNWADGVTGNTIGTFTVQYINKGSGNATAYDLQMNITPYLSSKGFKNHKPANFRIVATDGTEIPISSMTPTGNQTTERNIPFKDLPELTAAALSGKNIGLTDVDGDGFYDDFPKDAKLKIRFEMVKNQEITCLQNDGGTFSVSPHSNFSYIDACGTQNTSPVQVLTNNTFRRLLTGISDNSKFPGSLSQGERTFGYLSFGQHTIISQHIKEGFGRVPTLGARKLKYEIKLPPGVEMKNVKFLTSEGYGQEVVSTRNLPDVAPGQTFSYTTMDGNKGYVTFELLLTTPCILGTVPLEYRITYLDKNGDTATYSEIPLICRTIQVGTICPGTCAGNGPVMLKTKVERADDSYGWTDYTMNTRQTRANVSAIDRSRALHLDEVEFISEGEQGGVPTHNLYYHAQVKAMATLIPKQISLKVGNNPIAILPASTAIVTEGTNADGKFFRWNLSSALPAQGIAVGEKFSVVATYQVNNSNSSNSRDNVQDTQVGGATFFYMLANPNDTDIHSAGFHTHEMHCGAKQTPSFYIAETYTLIGTNAYNIKGCEVTNIGTNQAYLARRFGTAGTYYTNEFRPSHRIKTLKITVPKSYNMVRTVDYSYLRDPSQWIDDALQIPVSDFQVTDDGTYKTYTYTNPAKGSAGYLYPGSISVENVYGETIRTWLQATCDSKVFVSVAQATTDKQLAKIEIDFEDFYYHYADKADIPVVKTPYEEVLRYTDKPAINLLTQTPQTITANKREQHIDFQITNTSLSDAPYGWVSVPDVVGIEVSGLEEINASGTTLRTFSPATGISGEKMFFLDSDGQSGTIAKGTNKLHRLKYKVTNCTKGNISFDLYAGWNCNGNPSQGYTKTCNDNKVTYNVKIAKSLKQITPSGTNPGVGQPGEVGEISMCQKTKYEYTINSGDEGDIFDVKLVIIKQRGLTISDVEIEYPLGSGTKYSNIIPTESGNKITYDLTSIFPKGSLPGSISESDVNKRNFKLSFMLKPDCDFTAGSSFDIDIEGNNLCGDPAEGDRSKAIIAGIDGMDANKYRVNNSLILQGGNANACASPSYATYKGRHEIVDTTPLGTFSTGDKGLVVMRIPKGFEYVTGSFTVGNKSNTTFADPVLPTNPIAQVGDGESELNIKIPQGMKNADFFEYTIQIKQKDNTPATECSQVAELIYYTTDKATGVACPGGGTNPCPTITVETSQQRGKVTIPVDRAKVKIENVQLTSVVVNNKEKVTFTYTLKNESTTFAYTGNLKISLFLDTNNNQLIEEGTDTFLQDFTVPSLSLVSGATVQKTHTIELGQNQVCRLLLSIRNNKNYCLCNNLAVITSAPTVLTDLVSDMTLCENEQKTFSYNTQAPTYESYTWSSDTVGALSYLSDSQVKNPIFRYTGAPLTAQQIITYKLTIKRTNGCAAIQQVQVKINPATATPSAPNTGTFCQGATIASLKDYIDNTVSGTIRVYTDDITTTTLADNVSLTTSTYYYSAEVSGRCESDRRAITVNMVATPTVQATYTYCVGTKVETLWDAIDISDSDRSLKIYENAIGGLPLSRSSLLRAGNYYVSDSSTSGNCETPRVPLTVVIQNPVAPAITTPQNFCAVEGKTLADLSAATNLKWYATSTGGAALPRTTLLQSATYYASQEVGGCEGTNRTPVVVSVTSIPDVPTLTLIPENCISPTKVVISNYVGGQTYWHNGSQLTVDRITHEIIGLTAGTYTITTKDGNCQSGISSSFEIKAKKPVTAITTSPVGATYTQNTTAAALSIVSSGIMPTAYKWYRNTTNSKTGSDVTQVATTATYTPPTNQLGSLFYWVELTGCGTVESAIAEIKVMAPAPTIVANDDPDTSVAKGGMVDVLGNDTLNGNPVTRADVAITIPNNGGLTGLTVDNTTGKLKVPANATAGTYTVTYKICDKMNPTVCDMAKVKITVTSPTPAPTIVANDDPDTSVAKGGTVDILSNDRLNGNPVAPTDVNITIPNKGGLTGLTVDNTTGKLKVPANATPGTYTVTYNICDKMNPTVCDMAKVKITVTSPTPTIVANDDPDASVAKGGTVDILSNDRLNGNPVAPTDVNITIPNKGGLTGLTVDNTTGKLKVPANATPGTYTVTYNICDKMNPTVCDTAKVKITVTSPTPTPTIVANDDPDTSVAKGGTVDILSNDTLNGTPVTRADVAITIPNKGGLTNLTVEPSTGKLKIPTDATPGTYIVTYKICDKANPTVCDMAKVKITVTSPTPTPTIVANDDPDASVAKGGMVDMLGNDTLNGNPVTRADVAITIPNNGGLTGLTVDNTTGKLKVPANATPGTYTVTYKICAQSNLTVCDTAKVKITVTTTKRTIKAVDDNFGKISNIGDYTTIETVFSSGIDTLEGVVGILSPETDVILHKGEVTRQDGTAAQAGTITMNNNGSITVKKGTPVGIYTYTYKICEKVVPTNCDSAKVTFEVVSNPILAKDDEFEVGTLGGLTTSILNNDILGSKVGLSTSDVIIEPTLEKPVADKHLVMRFTDGRFDVKSGIALGTYKYYYTIADKRDKTKASSAVVTIKVVSFTAVDDENEIINDKSKEQKIPSVLDNDEVDGKRPKPEDNVIFRPTPVKDKDGREVPGIVINPQDGKITVAPNTPDGTYTYSYTICKKMAPTECKTAKGVLKLLPALKAVDDDFTATPVNPTKGAVKIGNVLENDLYAGGKALDNLDKVTATIGENNGGLSGVKIDEQGNLIIPQGAPVGVYDNIEYNLCMKDHPGACKTAKIKVEVIKDKPLTIYNGVSADGDGHNDYFKIEGIEYYPKNNLKIFNRWGVLVYERDGYTNNEPFDGHSNGRATISADSKLPQGTYYYILEYEDSYDQSHTEKGWLYLKY
ncbi:gliding motility-associated C-terminal domain-containing protein [Capnocytophaga gingivalis]|uniref:Gliding motility-associated C-terminal domain-containing protein n=1 Tax=Capnocytophaga gingivalis TaxID=1017 RepID=A0ABU5Z9V7_9FLAO|nr:gliding motility-associated C-terminal domain-containing protein [Capnocytophaga gingivalis]MEB3075719.1 gliding motility-associated C-terminal domain-containing protein [Capnocytophaga gingivalis]